MSNSCNEWQNGVLKKGDQCLRHEANRNPENDDDGGKFWNKGQGHFLYRRQGLKQADVLRQRPDGTWFRHRDPSGERVPATLAKLIDEGATRLGGRLPVNTSGGLLRKGHPVGATGIAQVVELTEQLQGRSGERQVEGARVGLAQNGGGNIGTDVAAMCVTVLTAS